MLPPAGAAPGAVPKLPEEPPKDGGAAPKLVLGAPKAGAGFTGAPKGLVT